MLLKNLIIATAYIGTALFLDKKMKEKEENTSAKEKAFTEEEEKILKQKNIPDRPVPFDNVDWFAVKSINPDEVLAKLNLYEVEPANWRAGLYYATKERANHIFVSPSVNGWTFIIGKGLPMSIFHKPAPQSFKNSVELLSKYFPEAQLFKCCSWRDEQFYSWIKAKEGSLIRSYSVEIYSSVRVVENLGELTSIEQNVFHSKVEFNGVEQLEFSHYRETLLTIAGDWSIDPRKLGVLFFEPNTGFLGRYPHG